MKKVLSSVLVLAMIVAMAVSLAGCKDKKAEPTPTPAPTATPVVKVEVSMADIVDTLVATYGEDYLATEKIEEDVFAQLTGITSDMYEEAFAAMAPDGDLCDLIVVVKPNEADAETVISNLEAYRDTLLDEAIDNIEKINASTVETYEDYVILRILGAYYEPEVTEGEEETTDTEVAEGTEVTEEAEPVETTEVVTENAEADFYEAEVEKGTKALEKLAKSGFTAMTDEERAEIGFDVVYAEEEEPEVSGEPSEAEPPVETETEVAPEVAPEAVPAE